MARTTGPLMSMDASGTVGKAIVFAKWKGRNYVRRWVIPSNPKSDLQVATRAMMKYLTQIWSSIETITQATWADLADAGKVSPFNAFISRNMSDWTQSLAPSKASPALRAAAVTTPASIHSTGGIGQANGTVGATTDTDIVGVLIFASNKTVTGARAECRLVLPAASAVVTEFSLVGLMPGTWKINATFFAADGAKSSLVAADASVTVS